MTTRCAIRVAAVFALGAVRMTFAQNDPTFAVPGMPRIDEEVDRFEKTTTYGYDGATIITLGRPTYSMRLRAVAYQDKPKQNFVFMVVTRAAQTRAWQTADARRAMVLIDGQDVSELPAGVYDVQPDPVIRSRDIETVSVTLPAALLPKLIDKTVKAEFRIGEHEFQMADPSRDALRILAWRAGLAPQFAPTAGQVFGMSAEAQALRAAVYQAKADADAARDAALAKAHAAPAYRGIERRREINASRLSGPVVGDTRREFEANLAAADAELKAFDEGALSKDTELAAKKSAVDDAERRLRDAESNATLPKQGS